MEEKIIQIYVDLIRTYNAEYNTLLTKVPFSDEFRATQGSLYATEHTIMRLENDFPTLCHCGWDWKNKWKDENFK